MKKNNADVLDLEITKKSHTKTRKKNKKLHKSMKKRRKSHTKQRRKSHTKKNKKSLKKRKKNRKKSLLSSVKIPNINAKGLVRSASNNRGNELAECYEKCRNEHNMRQTFKGYNAVSSRDTDTNERLYRELDKYVDNSRKSTNYSNDSFESPPTTNYSKDSFELPPTTSN